MRNSLQRWRKRRNRLGVCLCACQRCFLRCTLHTARTTTWPPWHSRRYSRPLPLTPPDPSQPHSSLSPDPPLLPHSSLSPDPPLLPYSSLSPYPPLLPHSSLSPDPPLLPHSSLSPDPPLQYTLPLLPSCMSAWRRCEGRPVPGTLNVCCITGNAML